MLRTVRIADPDQTIIGQEFLYENENTMTLKEIRMQLWQ